MSELNSLGPLGGEELVLGELKVLVAVTGAGPAGDALTALHLRGVVEAEVVIATEDHPVTLRTEAWI